jgi:hydroxymethylbilane synthase
LALAQVAEVHLLLADHLRNFQIEIVPLTTSGDKIQDRNLSEIGGKGLFIKELEEALVQNKIDIAVHSAKDVPPIIHVNTDLAAFTPRMNASDCLISKKFKSLKNLPKGAVVGTSSARRKAILLRMRPDLKIINFRGNVDTRLSKLDADDVDASILAVCGLERLEKQQMIKEIISMDDMLPSGGQGSLAIQVRKNDQKILDLVTKINHEETKVCIKSERAFLHELSASCATPVGVYAWIEKNNLNLKTLLLDYDGGEIFATNSKGNINVESAIKLGIEAAKKTKNEAEKLLTRIGIKN